MVRVHFFFFSLRRDLHLVAASLAKAQLLTRHTTHLLLLLRLQLLLLLLLLAIFYFTQFTGHLVYFSYLYPMGAIAFVAPPQHWTKIDWFQVLQTHGVIKNNRFLTKLLIWSSLNQSWCNYVCNSLIKTNGSDTAHGLVSLKVSGQLTSQSHDWRETTRLFSQAFGLGWTHERSWSVMTIVNILIPGKVWNRIGLY